MHLSRAVACVPGLARLGALGLRHAHQALPHGAAVLLLQLPQAQALALGRPWEAAGCQAGV